MDDREDLPPPVGDEMRIVGDPPPETIARVRRGRAASTATTTAIVAGVIVVAFIGSRFGGPDAERSDDTNVTAVLSPEAEAQQEHWARIRIRDGSGEEDDLRLARSVAGRLDKAGYAIESIGKAVGKRSRTLILYTEDSGNWALQLADRFFSGAELRLERTAVPGGVNVLLVLGPDARFQGEAAAVAAFVQQFIDLRLSQRDFGVIFLSKKARRQYEAGDGLTLYPDGVTRTNIYRVTPRGANYLVELAFDIGTYETADCITELAESLLVGAGKDDAGAIRDIIVLSAKSKGPQRACAP